jgi:hypothetical protein
MDENFLSLLGLGITRRTCVTNRIVLPSLKMSAVEKPLFSIEFPIMVRSSVCAGNGDANHLALHFGSVTV